MRFQSETAFLNLKLFLDMVPSVPGNTATTRFTWMITSYWGIKMLVKLFGLSRRGTVWASDERKREFRTFPRRICSEKQSSVSP